MKKKKQTRGGAREGSGRKSPFKEKTKGVKFMTPESKVNDLKAHVKPLFDKWVKEGV